MFNNELWQKPAGGAGGSDFYDYQIANSVFLNGTSQSLRKTWGSAASDDNKKALSFWIKRTGSTGTRAQLGSTLNTKLVSTNNFDQLEINTGNPSAPDQFHYGFGGGAVMNLMLQQWRDPSAWMHIIWIWNSDESTAVDRLKFYVNGVNYVVNDSTYWNNVSGNPYPGSGNASNFGKNGNTMHIADYQYNNAEWFGGQMAEWIMIDGAASYTDFGEFKNGVWKPVDPSGLTFGDNGFHLDFADASAPGNDVSGNNNDFTNIGSIPASAQLGDSPTFNSNSNGGNFATIGPLWKTSDMTFSEGNLKWTCATNERGLMSNWAVPIGTKAYWEYIPVSWGGNTSNGDEMWIGINQGIAALVGGDRGGKTTAYGYGTSNGYKTILASTSSYGATIRSGDIVGVAVDRVNHTINFSKNGSWQGTFAISSTMDLFPFIGSGGGSSSATGTFNFGQDGTFAGTVTAQGNSDDTGYGNFFYAPPTGFLAMCAGNLPVADAIDPAQTDDNYPQKLFSAKTYTGTGSSNAITGLGFQPDWVWIKKRNGTTNHSLFDSSRGTGKYIATNNSNDEGTDSATLNAFGSDGFTVVSDTTVNASSDTYVAWNWRANGGTTSTNTSGSVDSTVQVDPSGAFSVVTWAGGGGNATLGHGLSGAPTFMAAKSRTSGAPVMDWPAFHKNMNNGAFPANESRMYWSDAGGYGAGALWQTANNSASLFGVTYNINDSGKNYVAYCFTDVEGYCKADYYVGNGNADGPFVYTGFRPAYIWYKATSASESWVLIDNARNPFNVSAKALGIEDTWAESDSTVTYGLDILSNGFKVRGTNAVINSNGSAYIYLAMAHNPFKYATAR